MGWLGYIVAVLFLAAIWTKISQMQTDIAAIREDLRALRDR
jgi:hypothetical protein